MLRPVDDWYLLKEEPIKSCLQFLRLQILKQDPEITEAWKYGMPFFCFRGKMICYLWIHKKFKQPYIGIVDGARLNHPGLIREKRARMRIFLVDPAKNIPVRKIKDLLQQTIALYE